MRFSSTRYILGALVCAEHEELEDGSYFARIPECRGVIAFGNTLRERRDNLRSTLEDWILVGLKLGHRLPVINDINLNRTPGDKSEGDQ